MFYSHEVLTSRRYGVATVWLVATLGSKSSTKKVTRKAIMGVNLKKACETIIEPDAPMALRLQSNLLYGVSRIYTQKWDYLLSDTQAIHTSIRTFLSATRGSQIDKNAGKARPDQLIIVDDPAFIVDNPIEPPPLDFDSIIDEQNHQRSSQSFLSIRSPRNGSNVSAQSGPILGLDLPSSSHGDSFNSYKFSNNDGSFGEFSAARRIDRAGINVHDDEQLLFHNDDLFEIDDFGEIRELSIEKKGQNRSSEMPQKAQSDLESATNKPAFEEYKDAVPIHEELIANLNPNDQIRWLNKDEEFVNENVELFPVGILDGIQSRHNDPKTSKESSPISAQATQKRKRVKTNKNIIIDEYTELGIFDMRRTAAEYHKSIIDQIIQKTRAKEISTSKKNALFYIFGAGINNIGEDAGLLNATNKLATFSGEALYERTMGHFITPLLEHGRKRSQSESEIEDESTSKRARSIYLEPTHRAFIDKNEFISPHEDEFGYDKSMEVGREPASALKDYPSSGMMPWNMSASAHSRPGSSMQRLGNRLTPASPLFGRGGSNHPIDLEGLLENKIKFGTHDLNAEKNKHTYRFPSDDGDDRVADINSFSQPWHFLHGDMKTNESGIFGPEAEVDTQTATTSQWVREALDQESINFFDFLRSTIINEINCHLIDNIEEIGISKNQKYITFSKLIEPEKNSYIVATQAFYHVLNLANKNVILAKQKSQDGSRIDSDIFISVI